MKSENIKSSFLNTMFFVLSLGLVVYSCSSEDYEFLEESSVEASKNSTAELGCRSMLVETVTESDEFMDYLISCNSFSDKIDKYMSTLTMEEKTELFNNVNNDDYIQYIIDNINVEKEISAISLAREKLFKNTPFLQLNAAENLLVFEQSSAIQGCAYIKSREEGGGKSACEEARQKAYNNAYSNFTRRLSLCDYLPTQDKFACQVGAKANYEAEKTQADTDYRNCINR